MKYYYLGRKTFTQQYGTVLKKVQTNLFQKGLLIRFEDALGGGSKAERQRFLFPDEFVSHLPSPFSDLRNSTEKGTTSDESIRKEIKTAITRSPSSSPSGVSLTHRKLYFKKDLLSDISLKKLQLQQWAAANGAAILKTKYFDDGKTLADFVLHYLQQLPAEKWFSEKSVSQLLSTWDAPKKRNELDIDKKYPSRYEPKKWCEAGWKTGFLEKCTIASKSYYRLATESTAEIKFEHHLTIEAQGTIQIDLTTIPLSLLLPLNQVATFQTTSATANSLKPDLVNISSLPNEIWTHPLINWLQKNAPTFKEAFAQYKKKYGKEIIHQNLLVAKVTDLSLRVLIEKGLPKEGQLVVLSDEFIAFPPSVLPTIERIISKSGNVIKQVTA
ncbi:MAG: hypothetical protein AAF960_05575 [Bacteroidota bacterium]